MLLMKKHSPRISAKGKPLARGRNGRIDALMEAGMDILIPRDASVDDFLKAIRSFRSEDSTKSFHKRLSPKKKPMAKRKLAGT